MYKMFLKNNPVYLITDTNISGLTHFQAARRALAAGVRTIQLREKHMSRKDIYREAAAIRDISHKYNAAFIVNDYIDIAMAVNADGVHLGQEDMPLEDARRIMGRRKIIGVSTHSLKQAVRAESEGADYIAFGPVFNTTTKDAGRPKGIKSLRSVRKHICIPVVAIGGISWENVKEVLDAGADAAAVASAVLSGNIKTNVGKFMTAVKQA